MSKTQADMTIGTLARAAGVNVETIRFYQRRGLLPEPERAYGAIRRYDRGEANRIRFIKSAQRLGFSLDEVAGLLRLEDGAHCEEARLLAEAKLADVRVRLAALARMEAALAGLVGSCRERTETVCCPLIAALWDPH